MIARSKENHFDITVLMGGPSNEREISLLSGKAIAEALEQVGHRVTRADIHPGDTSALDRKGMDLVFIALHGDFGESGELQQLCEDRSLRYTGSSARASKLGMDKAAAKQICKRAGLVTPDWMIIEEFHDPALTREWLEDLSVPVVVKPVTGGSSLDVTLCHEEARRDAAVADLLDLYERAMIERLVSGREVTVGILGDETLPLIEIIPARPFYDYFAKYNDGGGTEFSFDHELAEDVVARCQADALKAHQTLGCRDISRVDFILDEQSAPQFLEINTIPGFTSHSLVPMAAAKAGIEFPQLADRIVQMAMTREMCFS
jgi:D-alanine-D-alanine ligase